MSKKRSLGSSPIGFKSDNKSMGFIPDLGVSRKKKNNGSSKSTPSAVKNKSKKNGQETSAKKKKSKKKIVSYNLEVDLIDEVKNLAKEKDMYYSSLVSLALKCWITENS